MNNDLACLASVAGKKLGMSMPTEPKDKPSKGLIDLPSEVRKIIWETLVVVPQIRVRTSAEWAWNHPITHTPFSRDDFDEGDAPVSLPLKTKRPDLSMFHVCRLFYEEAMEVYYSQNNFAFCVLENTSLPSELGCIQQSIQRQPAHVLQYIKHMELDILDHTTGPQVTMPCFDKAYTDFARLITCDLRIQHLTLHIRAKHTDRSFAGFGGWKQLAELCKIPKLRRLTIKLDLNTLDRCSTSNDISCFNPVTECGLASTAFHGMKLIEQLRSNMLENGARLGTKMIRAWTTRRAVNPGLVYTGLLLEVDNNNRGECLLPALDDARDTYPGAMRPFSFSPVVTGFLDKLDEEQYVQLQKAAHEYGRKHYGIQPS
ncbi:hypothetical protein VMCG_03356 [Cytospora schulzeri]|uniref:F-box domain-containing protein n=1 Tax=Cytospora schulzeri TaxID=448051 RepID=A0A423WWH4_9PEZI|nr:hypothetical protein VMCG_03356 [Valsa malicola]